MSVNACAATLAPMASHQALFYRDADEYVDGIVEFIDAALASASARGAPRRSAGDPTPATSA